jgi:acyl-CoA synthetase (AMP-forming)/AMP-acid ligase II
VPGLDVRVVDTELRPVPSGVAGELCVGGATPRRTGRLARFSADGELADLGPVAQRTVRDGQPVDLQLTRELLDAHPSVLDSVVVLRPDGLVGCVG